jgi:hypothetical protein
VGVADLPLDLVVRIATGDREQALHRQRGVLVDDVVDELVGMDLDGGFVLYGRHLCLLLIRTVSACEPRLSVIRKGDGA